MTDTVAATQPGAPHLWNDAEGNVCLDDVVGDQAATEAAFARAAHVAKFETWIPRVTGVPMEPRAAVAEFVADTQRYTLHAGSGGAVRLKTDLAQMLNVLADAVRVTMGDVGGNFGTRGMIYPEFALVAWAARRVGRPVKWTCERSEAFLSDYHDASFPYGSHVCEVEIDPALGTLGIVRYTAVDDVGRAVNPMIIHGQVHGGIAQGAGQALLEQCVFEWHAGSPPAPG